MAIDPYSPCPCGSGKKLKFCCADLASDLEKIQRTIAGEQPHAALKHVEQLLEKHPRRASLFDIRASLELSLHEFEAAQKTIDAFIAIEPDNASAHAQAAILNAANETGTKSIAPLQDALEQLGDEMPLRVLEAIGAVGQALLMEGELVAARGHLLLYAAIAPEDDNRALELLLRMNLQAGMPLLMREYLLLLDCPDGVAWRAQFDEASRLSGRGLWRRAEAILSKLRDEVGPEPAVVFNLALTRGWLGQSAPFAAGLHEYATLDVDQDSAVEAEALAQLVDPELEDPKLETVKVSYAVGDVDLLAERLAADKRTENYPLDLNENGQDEAIRPRSTHVLLDRPAAATGIDIGREEIPNVVAFLCVYGKRTDREARIEATTDRGDSFDSVRSLLAEVAGDTLGEVVDEEVVAEKSISEESLSWRWRLPDDTPADHRRKLLSEQRRDAILNHWTASPRAALSGKSPREAVGDESLRIALLASALIVEQAAVDPSERSLFEQLREHLKLPEPETIDPAGLDLEHVPLVRVPRIELSKLEDQQVAKLLDRAILMGANLAAIYASTELVRRPQLADGVDVAPAYRQLIRLEPNEHRAAEWVSEARAWSLGQNQSVSEWVLMDLELSIQRGQGERVQSVLHEIRENHIGEPGVAEAAYRLLVAAGLAPPQGPVGAPTPSAPATGGASPAEGQGIWTPGEASGSATAEGEEKPAIWTP